VTRYGMDALEFLARWVTHVPEHYETPVRYYAAYATRRRLWWMRRGVVPEGAVGFHASEPEPTSPAAPSDDWPGLRTAGAGRNCVRRVYQVEVSLCPDCGGDMRIVPFVIAPGGTW